MRRSKPSYRRAVRTQANLTPRSDAGQRDRHATRFQTRAQAVASRRPGRGRRRRCRARPRRRCPGEGRPPSGHPGGRRRAGPARRERLEVPGEILAAEALLRAGHRVRARHLHGRGAERPTLVFSLTHRRHAADVVDLGPDVVRRHEVAPAPSPAPGPRARPRRRGSAPCPRPRPSSGMALAARAGRDPAPDQAEAGPRVDPARQCRRQLGHDLRERVDQVGGEVRPGGVPARAGEPHRDLVGGGGDRPAAQPDLADLDARVAVQREDPVDAGRARRPPMTSSAPPRGLLGGLEDQPDAPGSWPAAACSARTSAAPSRIAVCTSWPQAWQTPGTVER